MRPSSSEGRFPLVQDSEQDARAVGGEGKWELEVIQCAPLLGWLHRIVEAFDKHVCW